MASSGTPTQQAAQSASSLGDSSLLVQQLYSLSTNSFLRFLFFNPTFQTKNLPAANADGQQIYPCIFGGARDPRKFDCSGIRTAYGDLFCTLTLTLAPGDAGSPQLYISANATSISIDDTINVTLQGSLTATYKDPTTISPEMKTQYKLDKVNWNSLRAKLGGLLTWMVKFQPESISNDYKNKMGQPDVNGLVNTCYKSVFQDELSAVLVCVYLCHGETDGAAEIDQAITDKQKLEDQKLSLWIAPSEDADDKDTSQNILVVVQRVPPNIATIDRNVYPPPWFQQWRIPGDPIDNVIVLSRDEFWTQICTSLNWDVIGLAGMDGMVSDWYTETHTLMGAPDTAIFPWVVNSTPNDFDWQPGNVDNVMGSQSIYRIDKTATDQRTLPVGGSGDGLQSETLIRTVGVRLYFTPGDDSTRSPLPMQTADSTCPVTPTYQMVIVGKTAVNYSAATVEKFSTIRYQVTMELFWQMFFSVTQLTQGHCAFEASTPEVTFTQIGAGTGFPPLVQAKAQALVDQFKASLTNEKLTAQLTRAITVDCNVYCPTQKQFSSARCLLNNEGDLIALAAFS